jgi:hypothetical protein
MGYPPEYISNPSRVPYEWVVIDKATGLIQLAEFDPSGVKLPLSEVFKRLDSQKVISTLANGEEIFDNVTDFVAEREFIFRIVPQREGLHEFEFDFTPGMKLIYEKVVTDTIGLGGAGAGVRIEFETVTFGRVLPDGREQVLKIWPDGSMKDFDSLADARKTL